jgi:uncharacterized membrane protein YoaK (UPF0700 family)
MNARRHSDATVLGLAFVAGLVDVIGWLLLHGIFTAHVTGNIVVIAAHAVTPVPLRPAALLAVPAFFLVAVAAHVWIRVRGIQRGASVLLIGQTLLLAGTFIISIAGGTRGGQDGPVAVAVALTATAAMAVQNVYLHTVRNPSPSTAVMTGNLTALAMAVGDILTRAEAGRAAVRRAWPLLAGFVLGCIIGAIAATTFTTWAWWLPLVASVGVTLITRRAAAPVAAPQ